MPINNDNPLNVRYIYADKVMPENNFQKVTCTEAILLRLNFRKVK